MGRRAARLATVEPVLQILELRSTVFDVDLGAPVKAWQLLARAREIPAQPSTRRDA